LSWIVTNIWYIDGVLFVDNAGFSGPNWRWCQVDRKLGNRSPEAKNFRLHQNCNRSAVPQMRERGLSAIHTVCGQADDKADAVLLNDYETCICTGNQPEEQFFSLPYIRIR
jgi:hypothetical protein